MATKKPKQPQATPTWGKTLSKQELLALLDRLDQRKNNEQNER
jgi:hypothetical protein